MRPTARTAWIESLDPDEADALLHDWQFWARETQRTPPGDWRVWLLRAGRGYGKTRVGGEFVRERIDAGIARRVHLVARTASDVRDVVVEGESGMMGLWPASQRPRYEPSKRRLTFHTGAVATVFTADEPDLLRGPQCDTAWADELATWKRWEAWTNLLLGLRLGADPRVVATTTPRPTSLIRDLSKHSRTHLTTGTMYENRANLAPAFVDEIVERYEGTRLGRQELLGELLEEVDGALITAAMIDGARVDPDALPDLVRVVVGVDPALTSGERSDSTGIVVDGRGVDGDLYTLADRTCRLGPTGWSRRAVEAFEEFHADSLVVEKNAGGEMAESVIRSVSRTVPIRMVTARRSKQRRAEPILALYEQGRAHHVGTFAALEDQLLRFTSDGYEGDDSPDDADAHVHAATDLMVKSRATWSDLGYGRTAGAQA